MSTENSHVHDFNMVKAIWRTFWILLAITVIEVVFAVYWPRDTPMKLWAVRVFFILMSLAKAYFIVSIFMHMKFELKHLALTVLIPFCFIIYAIIMLLWEGSSWLDMRIAGH